MPRTPGRKELPYADEEINYVQKILPSLTHRTILSNPTKATALENLDGCSVVHHGEVDPDPSKSRILLSDWKTDPFNVSEISSQRQHRAELAYISSCHGMGIENTRLVDEAIHIAGALRGFRVQLLVLCGKLMMAVLPMYRPQHTAR
jgi:CHAT domain-containing protein